VSWPRAGGHPGPGSESGGHQDAIRVLVAEARVSSRVQICDTLSQYDDMVIVAATQDGAQTIQCAGELTPDVVVLSMRMPDVDCIDAVRQIVEVRPGARIVMFGYPEDRPWVLEALRAGAVGYIPAADPTALALAVRRAARGEAILDTDVLVEVMAELRYEGSPPTPSPPQDLDPRDIEILKLVAQGASNSTIGLKMSCSERTVGRRLSRIYRQLGVQNRYQAVAVAMAGGWL